MKRKILFIISGSISAYKTLDLLRKFKDENFDIEVILTKSGSQFVTSLSISSLINKRVHTNAFTKEKDAASYMDHINLSRKSDLVVVCPASANIIAKLANGYADDLASTTLAASNKKIFLVPAMNKQMWANQANTENIKKLKKRKISIIGPIKGNLACGEFGLGRMINIEEIEKKIKNFFNNKEKLLGKKILITAGPTIEQIDPVRFISNFSSGKQGFEIAESANLFGAETILITGPTKESPPEVAKLIKVETADEMYNKSLLICKKYSPIDAAVFSAAVADWKFLKSETKYKKNINLFKKLKVKRNKDILATISNLKKFRPKIVCGFSAETNNLIYNSRKKLLEKKCDLIFANKITKDFNPMNSNFNKLSLIGQNREENWGKMSKQKIGKKIVEEIVNYLN